MQIVAGYTNLRNMLKILNENGYDTNARAINRILDSLMMQYIIARESQTLLKKYNEQYSAAFFLIKLKFAGISWSSLDIARYVALVVAFGMVILGVVGSLTGIAAFVLAIPVLLGASIATLVYTSTCRSQFSNNKVKQIQNNAEQLYNNIRTTIERLKVEYNSYSSEEKE